MKHLKLLVSMQLKDKIDLSWLKEKKLVIRNTILFLINFILITIITFILLMLSTKFNIFFYSEAPRVMILVLSLSLGLSLISCTFELMKNLYFAEDNRTLITLPVNTNLIFVSKLTVFYVYEIKRSFSFLIPITLGCVSFLISKGSCSFLVLIWMWLPMLFIVALPVLLGAILSIPLLYVYRFFKKNSLISIICLMMFLGASVYAIVWLIGLIPENIDLINQWPTVSKSIRSFLLNVEEKLVIMSRLIRIIIGEGPIDLVYHLNVYSFLFLLILIGVDFAFILLVYFASRPLFFGMMSKNFEINKAKVESKPNKVRNKYFTFINKEFMINLRTIDISLNYLSVYIIVPILILLLNSLYKAMDTKELGNQLIYTFNILIICLVLLSSNSLVATYYSSEGRTGYMKKTKPIYALYPLMAKLSFNAIFSIPTVFVTVGIFGKSVGFLNTDIVILGLAILLLHYGHMLWSAMLDVMNPQNEQYATTGIVTDNPNETKATLLSFIIAFLYAIISYKLLSEASLYYGDLSVGMIKLLIISLIFFGSILMLFTKRIKAYYYEIQG